MTTNDAHYRGATTWREMDAAEAIRWTEALAQEPDLTALANLIGALPVSYGRSDTAHELVAAWAGMQAAGTLCHLVRDDVMARVVLLTLPSGDYCRVSVWRAPAGQTPHVGSFGGTVWLHPWMEGMEGEAGPVLFDHDQGPRNAASLTPLGQELILGETCPPEAEGYETTHQGGLVRLWDVYLGQWATYRADDVPHHLQATLGPRGREVIRQASATAAAIRETSQCVPS